MTVPPEDAVPAASSSLPLDPPGPRVILGDLSRMLGRPFSQALIWVVLVAAAGVDIATFYQVLILVMNVDASVVWISVIGFTAIALALAHRAGAQWRDAVGPTNVVGALVTAWMCSSIWLLLGATAFVVRLLVQSADDAGGSSFTPDDPALAATLDPSNTTQHLSALLFLVLYLATGTFSGVAGFTHPHSAAKLWKRAQRKRKRAARRSAANRQSLAVAQQLETSIRLQRERRAAAVERSCQSAAVRLKQETRLLLASRQPAASPPPFPSLDKGVFP